MRRIGGGWRFAHASIKTYMLILSRGAPSIDRRYCTVEIYTVTPLTRSGCTKIGCNCSYCCTNSTVVVVSCSLLSSHCCSCLFKQVVSISNQIHKQCKHCRTAHAQLSCITNKVSNSVKYLWSTIHIHIHLTATKLVRTIKIT